MSARIHSRYRRTLTDLPSQGRRVVLTVCARRFRCVQADCRQRFFAERLKTTVGGPFARRTTRRDGIVHHLGLALSARGVAIKEIMRRTDKSRGLVRQVVRGGRADIFRSRMSSLDPFLTQLETAWTDGGHNGAALWRAMKTKGFTGSLRVVTERMTRKRKDEGTATRDKRSSKTPSARRIARMMTTERDTPSKAIARTVAMIGAAVPDLTMARDLLDRFHRLIQHRKSKHLDEWLEDAKPGLMASFASGIAQDHAAVKAALTEPWSNGQTEGQNTKLKLVKRQMYGRANLDLLRARLIGTT